MKRVLVTGAGGFVGRNCIAALLARGFEVHAVGRAPQVRKGEAVWTRADLLDPAQVERLMGTVRPSHLLHLAWTSKHGEYWHSPENYRWVCAGIHLARAFHQAGGERMLGVGTCAEYDWRYGFMNEDVTPRNPATPYGVCKNALFELWSSMAAQAGMSFAWGRLFHLYGPGEQSGRLVPGVARALLAGREAPCSDGAQVRDFLHAADAGEALAALLDSLVSGAVNVASGRPVSVRDVVERIAGIIGRHDLLRLGALPRAQNDSPLIVADVRRLTLEVGWSPRYSLNDGLAHTLDRLKRHVGEGA